VTNSHGRQVWSLARTSLNVKVTRGEKRTVHSHHPRQRQIGTRSLQITSGSSKGDHAVAAGRGWFRRAVYVW